MQKPAPPSPSTERLSTTPAPSASRPNIATSPGRLTQPLNVDKRGVRKMIVRIFIEGPARTSLPECAFAVQLLFSGSARSNCGCKFSDRVLIVMILLGLRSSIQLLRNFFCYTKWQRLSKRVLVTPRCDRACNHRLPSLTAKIESRFRNTVWARIPAPSEKDHAKSGIVEAPVFSG